MKTSEVDRGAGISPRHFLDAARFMCERPLGCESLGTKVSGREECFALQPQKASGESSKPLHLEQRQLLWRLFFWLGRLGFHLTFCRQALGFSYHNRNLFEIFTNNILKTCLVQSCRWMIHSNADIAVFFAGTPMNSADLLIAKELGHSVATQGDNNL